MHSNDSHFYNFMDEFSHSLNSEYFSIPQNYSLKY
jgi:hypothetical protein